MTFIKRLKFYLIGFFIGFIFLIALFGERMFSWSYFPNDRVLAEIKTKSLVFSPTATKALIEKNISQNFIADTALVKGKINFKESNVQTEPCPEYVLYYNDLKIKFNKCKEQVTVNFIY